MSWECSVAIGNNAPIGIFVERVNFDLSPGTARLAGSCAMPRMLPSTRTDEMLSRYTDSADVNEATTPILPHIYHSFDPSPQAPVRH